MTRHQMPMEGYSKEERLEHYRSARQARQSKLRRKRALIKLLILIVLAAILIGGIAAAVRSCTRHVAGPTDQTAAQEEVQEQREWIPVGTVEFKGSNETTTAPDVVNLDENLITSAHAILLNPHTNTIVAQKDAYSTISPASMTKILTVLVAAEAEPNLADTFTITREITDYSFRNKCSAAGFLDDETVTVRDLFYGTILPSGGDAAVALATYTAGSQEAFVELMNKKLEELGLADTAHFTNCVGLYDDYHYCTTYDMAIIMKAALENDLCREVLSAHTYTTSFTPQHPEGIVLSNWFLRRIEDKDSGGEVIAAKTGFVVQSGNCAASYSVNNSGTPYICVTANTYHSWRCIYDHVAIYYAFSPQTGDAPQPAADQPLPEEAGEENFE